MQDQIVSFQIASLAKDLGFNWETFDSYSKGILKPNTLHINHNFNSDLIFKGRISAPTQSLLQKWLREVHNIHVCANPLNNNGNNWEYRMCNIILIEDSNLDYDSSFENKLFPTYEQALEDGLSIALKLIK